MDAFAAWFDPWIRWVSLGWVVFAFLYAVLATALLTAPERAAIRRAEGAHWTERALRRWELQAPMFVVVPLLAIWTLLAMTFAYPPTGVVSVGALSLMAAAAAMFGSVVAAPRAVPSGSSAFGVLLTVFAMMPWLPPLVLSVVAAQLWGAPAVFLGAAIVVTALVEGLGMTRLLALLGVAERRPERDAEVGGAAFWRVATRGMFFAEDPRHGALLMGDAT